MALDTTQQITRIFDTARRVLLLFPQASSGDSIASALALQQILERSGKEATVVSQQFVLPRAYRFLPHAEGILSAMPHLQRFEIRLDINDTGLSDVHYHEENGQLRIELTPERGMITKDHVRIARSTYLYDAVCILGATNLHTLGELYEEYADLFHRVPIINIDHTPENTHFGHINLVDLTATSMAEIIYHLGQAYIPEAIDDLLATTLLTGIITKTRSFKHGNIAPHTLGIASELIRLGADRELVVANLFRTRSVAALRLWGKALTQLQHEPAHGLVWSCLTRDDFVKTGASNTDLNDIFDELLVNSPDAEVTLLLHEDHEGHTGAIHGILRTARSHSAAKLSEQFTTTATDTEARFTITGKTLTEVEHEVVNCIKAELTADS